MNDCSAKPISRAGFLRGALALAVAATVPIKALDAVASVAPGMRVVRVPVGTVLEGQTFRNTRLILGGRCIVRDCTFYDCYLDFRGADNAIIGNIFHGPMRIGLWAPPLDAQLSAFVLSPQFRLN